MCSELRAGFDKEADIVDAARTYLTVTRGLEPVLAAAELELFRANLVVGCEALVEGWLCLNQLEDSLVAAPPVVLMKVPLKPKTVKRASLFMITHNASKTVARLHKVANGCRWAKLEMRDVKLTDDPLPDMYNRRCKFCFPELLAANVAEAERASSEGESESS